jgi:hypothetical protein
MASHFRLEVSIVPVIFSSMILLEKTSGYPHFLFYEKFSTSIMEYLNEFKKIKKMALQNFDRIAGACTLSVPICHKFSYSTKASK